MKGIDSFTKIEAGFTLVFLWRLGIIIYILQNPKCVITRFNFYTMAHKSISLQFALWQGIKAVLSVAVLGGCLFRGVGVLGGLGLLILYITLLPLLKNTKIFVQILSEFRDC